MRGKLEISRAQRVDHFADVNKMVGLIKGTNVGGLAKRTGASIIYPHGRNTVLLPAQPALSYPYNDSPAFNMSFDTLVKSYEVKED